MKQFIITATLTVVCFLGMLSVVSSQTISAEQVRQVYVSIQAGR